MELIVIVIYKCVMQYFVVFESLFKVSMDAFVELIGSYIDLLKFLIGKMCEYPNNLIMVCGMNCGLFWVWMIIRTIVPYKYNY